MAIPLSKSDPQAEPSRQTRRSPLGRCVAPTPCRVLVSRRSSMDGMSLLEMVLVLAVLVAVAAIALPSLQGPMSDQRLRKSGDLVRAQWARARVQAVKSGLIHVFRYDLANDTYGVEPWYGEVDMTQAGAMAALTPSNAAGTVAQPPAGGTSAGRDLLLGIRGQRLPAGITFFSGTTTSDSRSAEVAAATAGNAFGLSGTAPIVFYPDGSASDAELVLTNERLFVVLSLRGLTGLARVSELLAAEELPAAAEGLP